MGVPIVYARPSEERNLSAKEKTINELKRQQHGHTRNQAAVYCGLSAT